MGLTKREDSPGGPCDLPIQAGYLCGPTQTASAFAPNMIHDDIRSLLESPPSADDAQALALEAERWRIERRIADVAARLGDEVTDEDAAELARLGQCLSSAD